MKTMALSVPTLVGLLAVVAVRAGPSPGRSLPRAPAAVAARSCVGCAGCEATYLDIGPSIPGLTVTQVPALHRVDDGDCDAFATGCVGIQGCEFNDAFFIVDGSVLGFVYTAGRGEFFLRNGQNRVTVKEVDKPCDVASAQGAFGNTHSVCVHAQLPSGPQQAWARHYICSWCEEN